MKDGARFPIQLGEIFSSFFAREKHDDRRLDTKRRKGGQLERRATNYGYNEVLDRLRRLRAQ